MISESPQQKLGAVTLSKGGYDWSVEKQLPCLPLRSPGFHLNLAAGFGAGAGDGDSHVAAEGVEEAE